MEITPQYGRKLTPQEISSRPVSTSTAKLPVARQVSKLETATNVLDTVFGGGKVGEAIGTGIAKLRATPEEREFISPGPSAKEVLGSAAKSASLFIPTGRFATGITSGLRGVGAVKGVSALGKIGAGAATGYAMDVASGLEAGEGVGEALKPGIGTAIGAAIPAIGVGTRVIRDFAGGLVKRMGQKIQDVVIKPSLADVEDGFKIDTLQKYGLGGSLSQTLQKTDKRIDDLSTLLNKRIESAPDVDLNTVFTETVDSLGKDKAKGFGGLGKIQSALDGLEGEIASVSNSTGQVSAKTAQEVKRAAGLFGAWKYGAPDPDSKAQEVVFNTFYRKLKEAVERAGGVEIKAINKQLSELIPVQHAIIRRIPIAERNQSLGLTDIITLSASTVEPSALLLTLANRATKSGRVGSFLVSLGDNLQKLGIPKGKLEQALRASEKALLSTVTSQTPSSEPTLPQ